MSNKNMKRISRSLLILMIVLFTFGFVGQGITYAVDFNIDNTPITGEFDTEIAKTSTTTEKGWLESAGDWVSDKWNGFTDWCGELWDDVNNILDDLGAKIKSIKDNLWEWGLTIGAGVTLAWAILKKQFPMLKVLEWAASFLKGVLRGLLDVLIGIFDLALGAVGLLGYVILNPRESWDKLKHWATHPGEVWDNISNAAGGIWKEITESWDRMVINGDGKSRSEWFGYAFSQLLGLKGVDKAGKAGNVVSKSGGLSSKFPLTSKAFDAISDSLTGLGDKVKSFGDNLFGSGKRILATTTAGAVAVTGLTFAWPKIEPLLMKFKDCVAVQQQDTGHYLASMQLAGKIDCPSGKAEVDIKKPDLDPEVKKYQIPETVTKFEDEIRNHSKEHGQFFDKNGNPVSDVVVGSEKSISLSDYKHLAKDATFTHNHPKNGPFSLEDLITAKGFDMAEIRAVTPNGKIYSMKRGKDGWRGADIDLVALDVQQKWGNDIRELYKKDPDVGTELYFKKIAEQIGGEYKFFKK